MRNWQFSKILIIALGGATALISLIAVVVVQITTHIEHFSAETSSAAYLRILADTQSFYSREIVGPAKKKGVGIHRDFANHPNSIPFPATFMHGLTEDLSRDDESRSFRFFSRIPIYERATSGPQDAFEKEALAFFEGHSDSHEFSQIEEIDGEQILRFAVALRMSESCVACHNAHVDSPKRDWALGDLRGVQAVSQPISLFSAWSVSRGGTWLLVLCGVSILLVLAIVITVALLARRHMETAHIKTLVWRDTICDLANRRGFVAVIEAELEAPLPEPFAVFMMDLVNFKNINDVHGHACGDDVLRIIGQRLANLPYDDIEIARIGGDEFAVLQRKTDDKTDVEKLAKSIVEATRQPICINGKRVFTGTTVGIALAPKHGQSARELLDNADMAMYRAKSTPNRQWYYYSLHMRQMALHAERLAEEIRCGINDGQFTVYYQPQFSLNDGRVFGLEALIRWNHPVEGVLQPSAFLPIAEERGLIIALSEVVVRTSIKDIMRWREAGLSLPRISINIHQDQVNDANHLQWMEENFQEAHVDPGHLTFEITEGCVLGRGSEHVPALLRRWRDSGYGVSLDDFGTGFASLSHLKDLPVSEFKIDSSFVRELMENSTNRAIVDGLIKLSKELGTVLIAEGVETLDQALLLRKMKCPFVQGYLFARPLPRSQAEQIIKRGGVAAERRRGAVAA